MLGRPISSPRIDRGCPRRSAAFKFSEIGCKTISENSLPPSQLSRSFHGSFRSVIPRTAGRREVRNSDWDRKSAQAADGCSLFRTNISRKSGSAWRIVQRMNFTQSREKHRSHLHSLHFHQACSSNGWGRMDWVIEFDLLSPRTALAPKSSPAQSSSSP